MAPEEGAAPQASPKLKRRGTPLRGWRWSRPVT